jgi:hypothetical protein
VTLDQEDLVAIARLVAELVGSTSGLVDAQTVAADLQVDREWVYARASELGAVRLGRGPKARLRFDLQRVRERVAELGTSPVDQPPPDKPSRGRPRRSQEQPLPAGVKLIQGRSSR